MATFTAGQFAIDTETLALAGPAEYLKERGDAVIEACLAGKNAVFSFGLRSGREPGALLCVALQTDFAKWRGDRQIAAMRKRSR